MKLGIPIIPFLFFAAETRVSGIDYVTDVLPIMKDHCWDCHSNENSVKGNLALDDADEFREYQIGKFNIIRPGQPEESGFVERLKLDPGHTDFMPRKAGPLSRDQIALIEQWIAEGAVVDLDKTTEEEEQRISEYKATGQTPDGMAGFESWTNRDGKVIEARMISLGQDSVRLLLKNGRAYEVRLADLSPESIARAKNLAESR